MALDWQAVDVILPFKLVHSLTGELLHFLLQALPPFPAIASV